MKLFENKKYLYFLIISIFLFFRTIGLGKDISNTDAYRWHYRSQNFLEALKSGDLKETYQHYQPGVTMMWINAFVKQASFSTQYHLLGMDEPKTLENADFFPLIHGVSKGALVVILGLLLFYQMKLLENLFSEKVAFFFGFFMAVEPYLIGIDRWMHLTSLETYFAFTSLLLLLKWNKKEENRTLVLSSLLFSLSVLSKITSLLTTPVYIVLIVLKNKDDYRKMFRNFTIFGFVSIACFLIFLPALITNPAYVLSDIYRAMTGAVSSEFGKSNLTIFNRLFFYDLVFFFKVSPIVLVALLGFFKEIKKYFKNHDINVFISYIFLYYIFLTVSGKKIDRYVIAMFPSFLLLASIFVSEQTDNIKKLFLVSSIFFIIIVSFMYHPVYSAYNSPLFGGTKSSLKIGVYDNSGEYFAQAALFLNEKGRDKSTFVPNGEASFFHYYKGKKATKIEESPDYVVVSHDLNRKEVDSKGCEFFEKGFGGKDMNVVFVYRCK